MMRRITALALVALALGTTAATAAGTKTIDGTLKGTSEWTTSFFATSWTIHGTYTTDTLGSGTYSGTLTAGDVLDPARESPAGCYTSGFRPCASPTFAVTGSITFTGDHGASFTTTVDPGSGVTAFENNEIVSHTFDLGLTITGGTKRYRHATGSLSLSYETHNWYGGFGCIGVFNPDLPELEVCNVHYDSGTLTGTIGR